MKFRFIVILLPIVLILAACANASASKISDFPTPIVVTPPSQSISPNTEGDMLRTDTQGMVSVDVTPINLTDPGDSLDFEVSLNTHSVNLNMDVASLASLNTDNGNTVKGIAWDGGSGGHHVSGKLSFPASIGGKSILDGATTLTLTIKNIDAPERVFTWSLNK